MKTKLKSEEDKEIFIIPSKEKTSNDDELIPIDLFISKINSEKQIFLWNKSSPIPRSAKVMLDVKFNSSLIKKYEKLIHIPKIIILKINCDGFSIWL